ncbi:hypothetical protein ATE47_12455 [Chryseobacterium sp. IHB B 17019]|uniref:hypothetical protein n=1 Tax=Chryseobacterium sp. IHB B 17019 TaxID=1721091 RepID=UPI0007227B03|nr:hypothetical protein [Chryseobacterium sp. IHB B 17019]ALR31284.1 hypothetical protein ATE47_12455 [Chryseobacterium sp. IHB B 17019]
MKIISLCLFAFVLLISCNKEKKQVFFKDNLYNEILKYQKKNPIPNKGLYKLFLYEISFLKNKDSLLTITVSPTGIRSKNSYGIYKDEALKSSYVIDSENIGNKFIKLYKKDRIDPYILEGRPPHIDVIYPTYKYKIKGDKLFFIDSIR